MGQKPLKEKEREPHRITITAYKHNTRYTRVTQHNTRNYGQSTKVKPQKVEQPVDHQLKPAPKTMLADFVLIKDKHHPLVFI